MADQILAITYFDEIIGPNLFYCSEPLESPNSPDLNRILEFVEDEGVFVFSFRKFQTINHLFYMNSKLARGGKDLIMISFLIKASYFKKEIVDVFKYLDSKGPLLKQFATELKELNPSFTEVLHTHKNSTASNVLELAPKDFQQKFLKLYDKYYNILTPQYELGHVIKPKDDLKKVYVMGPPASGKSTLIKNIEVIQFYNQEKDDLTVKFFDIITENLEIVPPKAFEEPNETGIEIKELLTKIEALILIFNISEEQGLEKMDKIFKTVLEKKEYFSKNNVPLVLIGNVFNHNVLIKQKKITKFFKIKNLKTEGIPTRYFQINIMREDDKLVEVLRWLVKNIL
ncbi:MAG: putative Small GTP-binding domain protein, Arf-domain signature [Promethearchaeota archaeon]|nr:MAG: putative Small GTP-binding domain protein, Arf-domain signature [Candidatus Lokiarchaeota archaeon]